MTYDALKAQQRVIASEIRQVDGILEWDEKPYLQSARFRNQWVIYKRGLHLKGDRSKWQNQELRRLLVAFDQS